MKPAMFEIEDKLKETGMSQQEIDLLMSRFLEEEAKPYVDCMELIDQEAEKKKEKIVIH